MFGSTKLRLRDASSGILISEVSLISARATILYSKFYLLLRLCFLSDIDTE